MKGFVPGTRKYLSFLSLMEPFFSLFKDVCGQRNHKIWGRTDNKIPCHYHEEHIFLWVNSLCSN